MADYLGTSKDDVLDQQKLGLADWSGTIRGLGGNDTLTGAAIHLQGGAGNDVLVGTVPSTTANYWDSPTGF
jgi:Ca2+-binding RTX toxin-like protein